MIFQFMKDHSTKHCITIMARIFKVSCSGYYAWRTRKKSVRARSNEYLLELIKNCQTAVKRAYGAKRVTLHIKSEHGLSFGHNRVAKLMKQHNLNAIRKRRWKKPREDKNLTCSIENILNREFNVTESNKVWVSDITYIKTTSGWRYHCAIMDLFNRGIVGRAFSSKMNSELVIDAFNSAMVNRNYPEGVLFHSDRGSQYCSEAFQGILMDNGFTQSLSRRGNCWDNACIESFF